MTLTRFNQRKIGDSLAGGDFCSFFARYPKGLLGDHLQDLVIVAETDWLDMGRRKPGFSYRF